MKSTKKIINKIRFLVKIGAEKEWEKQKYRKYLLKTFSCAHCKYLNIYSQSCSIPYLTGDRIWCFLWLEPENWLDKPKKI